MENKYPILDPNALIYIPYPRVNCLKTVPFTAAHTYIATYGSTPSPPGGKTHTQTSVQSFGQGNKKIWIPSKQKYLEFDIKEPLQDLKLTAEVKIESDALWCSGKVRNYGLMKRTKF